MKTTREQDRNLLFGVLAVQLKQVTPAQLVEAAALWAADPEQSLADRLVKSGALTEADRKLLDDFVDRAIAANDSDVTRTLAAFGGDDEIVNSFQGTVIKTPDGWNVNDETMAGAPPPDLASKALHLEPPGRYHERGEQGRGGMGRVLLVDDRDLGREIVMKILMDDSAKRSSRKARSDQESASKRARFLQEAQITGQLEHPSIVPVYELGQRKDSTPYYTMKYVRGETMSKALKRCSTMKERLALLPHYLDLCQAIAYAHSRGVIHRDLKPSNVMVGEYGETVVIDWGLAKFKGRRDIHASQLEDGLKTVRLDTDSGIERTKMGEVMGTPVYMPPEQARGDIEAIDERSDVYALGVILYQIITGQKPFKAPTPEKVVEKVINEAPLPIDDAAPDAPPELVAICERAMLKEPDARYPGAQALAEEIERFQSGAVVHAYEYRPAEYLGKFIRRHRPIVATATAALVAIVALSAWYVTIILGANRDLAAAADLEAGLRAAAEQEAYQSSIVLAQNEIAQQEPGAARRILRAAPERLRNWEWGYLYGVSDQSLMTLANHSGPLTWGRFSSDSSFVATASADGTVRLWDAATGVEHLVLLGHGVKVFGAAILPGDKELVSVSVDGVVKIWDTATGELLREHTEMQDDIRGMAVSRDGRFLATASLSGKVKVVELDGESPLPAKEFDQLDEKGLWCVAFGADGRSVAAGSETGKVSTWNTATGSQLRTFEGHTERVRSIAFSPDGTRMVTAGDDDKAIVWDARSGAKLPELVGHDADVVDAIFAGDGHSIVTASLDKTARIWDAASGTEQRTLFGHTQRLIGLALSPDGQSILTMSSDETARVWNLENGAETLVISGHNSDVTDAAFSPNGARILTVSNDDTAKLWDARTGSTQVVFAGHGHIVAAAVFSPDGSRVATASWDNKGRIWQAATGELMHTLEEHTGFVDSIAFSPDGRRLVTASWDHTAKVWNAETGAKVHDLVGHGDIVESAEFSPDGQQIITASTDKSARIWDAESGEELASIAGHDTGILYAAFSPDGKRIVTTSLDRTARLWDRASLSTIATMIGHTQAVTCAAFSPDGAHIVTTSSDATARLWNGHTGELEFVLSGHLEPVWGASFREDSLRVATASHDGTVRLWDVENGVELLNIGGQPEGVQSVAFDRSGRRMITGALDNTARIFEAGPWSERAWASDNQREKLVQLARRQSPDRTKHVFGFDREEVLTRLEALGGELKSATESGALDELDRQGLIINESGVLPTIPELACRKGDLLYRVNDVDVSSADGAALALDSRCTLIRSQADRPHVLRFEFVNFLERRIVEFRFPQLIEIERAIPRPVATQVLEIGIKNSKENRLRWAEEKGPRESDVVILTDLALYQQIGLEAQDRFVSINGVSISGLDSTIEAMEKVQAAMEAGTATSATVVYARDRLDQLIRVTFKITG